MKFISPKIHGIIDYLVVAFLWMSPTLFDLTEFVTIITYALGGVHLVLTLLTNFKAGVVKLIPFQTHGYIELIVSIVLVIAPWLLSFADSVVDRNFYIGFGIAVFLTWLITDYKSGTATS